MIAEVPTSQPYDTARRSTAARRAWKWRRLCGTPTPEQMACRRMDAALKQLHVMPTETRIYAATLAEHLLPHFTAAFSGDSRPALAIEVARRFAAGEVCARERLAALRLARYAVDRACPGHRLTPAGAGANAAAWCLAQPAHWGLSHALNFAAMGSPFESAEERTAFYTQHAEALEALAINDGSAAPAR